MYILEIPFHFFQLIDRGVLLMPFLLSGGQSLEVRKLICSSSPFVLPSLDDSFHPPYPWFPTLFFSFPSLPSHSHHPFPHPPTTLPFISHSMSQPTLYFVIPSFINMQQWKMTANMCHLSEAHILEVRMCIHFLKRNIIFSKDGFVKEIPHSTKYIACKFHR